ncbi:MAG: helix-turn-helix domain-containing protein [Lachnospiraceae bacterium]|nr:helix-turn-helix domain-containing protein [Lachnospiraceae bacterium]
MNVSNAIKEQRKRLSLSQEELGEKIYVTRQTISSWENGKSYPDIYSLILLSQVFEMTIDNLVKGDLEIMEQKIEKNDIRVMNRYGNLMAIGMLIILVLFPVSAYLKLIPGIVIAVLVLVITLYIGSKAEKLKKQYDVQTYREVVAFSKGETLDEISKIRESGKRSYQKFFYIIGSAFLGLIVSGLVLWILGIFG